MGEGRLRESELLRLRGGAVDVVEDCGSVEGSTGQQVAQGSYLFFEDTGKENVDNDEERRRLSADDGNEETMVNTKRYCFAFVVPAQRRVYVSTK
jgi:hypothetical protein